MSARTEKTLRLLAACVLATVFGIVAVATDSEAFGYAAAGIVLAGIIAGPFVSRFLVGRGEAPRTGRR
ncbi:MAG: hypothetical protein AB7V42_08030 [Thermoleophilia bacterium]